jgi:hypothetical protein
MREIRLSGSEGGGAGNSTGPPYPYRKGGPLGLWNLDDTVLCALLSARSCDGIVIAHRQRRKADRFGSAPR